MTGLRGVVAAVLAFCVAGTAQAQFVGGVGIGYGYGYGPGYGYGRHYYNPGMGVGAYPFNAWYVSPYRAISPGYVGTYGQGFGYTATYGVGSLGYGTSYGIASPVIVPPVYGTTTTIIRGGPTGGVVQYSTNGNGYTYVPDSTYPTVVQETPTLGLSRTYVTPSPPPVVVESRPQPRLPANVSGAMSSRSDGGQIRLVCPKDAGGSLTYSLNGNLYTIKPGYSQAFKDDRPWVLQFKRGGDDSEVAQHSLKAGVYTFGVGPQGWELVSSDAVRPTDTTIPPPPLPVAPLPDATLPSLSDDPLPLKSAPAAPPTTAPPTPANPTPPPVPLPVP